MIFRQSQQIDRRADTRTLGGAGRPTFVGVTRYSSVWLTVGVILFLINPGCQTPPAPSPRLPDPVAERPQGPAMPARHDPIHRFQPVELSPPPAETTRICGFSREGKPITMTVFGTAPPAVFIFGGIHGNEPTSALLAHRLIEHLRTNPTLYASCQVAILPEANPDGLALGTRGNIHGVDLNRNFPASNYPADGNLPVVHGPFAGSEPETQAILEAIRQVKPVRIVSIHSIQRGRHGNNFDGPARALAEEMSRHNGYPILPTMGYPTPGSFGTWAGVDQRIPTITLELPADNDSDTCWEENGQALLAVIRYEAETSDSRLVDRATRTQGGDRNTVRSIINGR